MNDESRTHARMCMQGQGSGMAVAAGSGRVREAAATTREELFVFVPIPTAQWLVICKHTQMHTRASGPIGGGAMQEHIDVCRVR